jgi:hypothetical protein
VKPEPPPSPWGASSSVPPPPSAPPPPPPGQSEQPPPPPPTRGTPWVAALAIIGVLVIAVAGLTVLLKSNGDDADPDAPLTEDRIDSDAGDLPADAETFRDPDGEYSMAIGADWVDSGGEDGEVGWYVNYEESGDNVNIMTESYDDSLQDYLDLSADSAGTFVDDFDLISSDIVTGPFGQEIGVWVYNASYEGSELTAYATIVVEDGTAVTATYVSPRDSFDANKASVVPYMMTLQRT